MMQVNHPILLPHELFAHIYKHHPGAFLERLLDGDVGNPGKFWESMRAPPAHPAWKTHPMKSTPQVWARCVPIALHGDGVPVAGVGRAWSKSIDIYNWSSLLSSGATKSHTFLIFGQYSKLNVHLERHDAFRVLCERLRWSFDCLQRGLWPTHDWAGRRIDDARAGTPLAEGWCAALWLVKGDLEWMVSKFDFESYNSRKPCALCDCNTGDRPWTDGRTTAAWRQTTWVSNAAWWAARPGRNAIFRIAGVGVLSFFPDLMHCAHLGVYQRLFGGVLKMLTHRMLPDSPAKNLAEVWAAITAAYQAR